MSAKRGGRVADWDCWWIGLPSTFVHITDKTRGQAKAETVRRAREAGYPATFPEIKLTRCIIGGTIWCKAYSPEPRP